MLEAEYTTQFKRDLKREKKRGKNLAKLKEITKTIAKEKKLGLKLQDHQLVGDMQSYRECHIEPNWLLIYRIYNKEKKVVFSRIGTHADLFK